MDYSINSFALGVAVIIILGFLFQGLTKLGQWLRGPSTSTTKAMPVKKDARFTAVILTIGAIVFIAILSAVARSPSTSVSPPTRTPRPTFAPSKIPIQHPTQTTQTPQPVRLHACVANSTIRIRKGPGTDYEPIAGMVSGTCMTIQGRNTDASWVYMVSDDGKAGWVAASLLTIEGNIKSVSLKSNTGALSLVPTSKVVPTSTRSGSWIVATSQGMEIQPTAQGDACSLAYPGVCIPPAPPDLDCGDIPYRRFRVPGADPHGFDRDGDGIGCE